VAQTTVSRECGGDVMRAGAAFLGGGAEGSGCSVEVWRTVAGYQRRPPWAVGIPSALSPFAIAVRLVPAARSRLIRSIGHLASAMDATAT
jgi:hypothetical protein